ncbi:Cof-type HAD-IIB family hydrolase [Terrilactibacillus laevilacticus]|uniref:Cof-type HAD-IIB family hydrolase n=1 Tax=Terrilactibacillus laevilacticus TaxID=1380157 RepID=A0ABW5PQG3_9BACI|nr:Cof-type HAD-IIB family hydrolase [Terrilactibacillus laevilacticus]
MRKYLIAVDLDGTLLTEEKTISKRTKTVLQQALNDGHIVVISTGRPYRASKMYYHELGLNTPIVNYNGAFIHHPLNPHWDAKHTPLDNETIKTIFQTCSAYDLQNIIAEHLDDVYIRNDEPDTVSFFNVGDPKIYKNENLKEELTINPTCLLIQPRPKDIVSLTQDLFNTHSDQIHHCTWGEPWNIIEVYNPIVNKAYGLQMIAQDVGAAPEDIIAFGDEENDIEMLKYAGRGVAMGNANVKIKSIADDVTLSNEDDGIAAYLERILV